MSDVLVALFAFNSEFLIPELFRCIVGILNTRDLNL